jgi:hypothetical protein
VCTQFYPTDIEETQKKAELNKLNSLTQTSDLGDFLLQADLAEKEFFAEKQNVVILSTQSYTGTRQQYARCSLSLSLGCVCISRSSGSPSLSFQSFPSFAIYSRSFLFLIIIQNLKRDAALVTSAHAGHRKAARAAAQVCQRP